MESDWWTRRWAGLGSRAFMTLAANRHIAGSGIETVLPGWSCGREPIYAVFPSRRNVPAKVRVFLEFVGAFVDGIAQSTRRTEFRSWRSGRRKNHLTGMPDFDPVAIGSKSGRSCESMRSGLTTFAIGTLARHALAGRPIARRHRPHRG
jgi:hypothetical protein